MSSQGAQVTVLYPRKDGATFDLDYYLKTHMPLAAKHWTKHGLKSYSVAQLAEDAPYSISAILEFESSEAWAKAAQDPATAAEIMADVPKFSSESPILFVGEVVARK